MICKICEKEVPGGFMGWCEGCIAKRDELPVVQDSIDRAVRVLEALKLRDGESWCGDSPCGAETDKTLAELCALRARERELVAAIKPKSTPGGSDAR
jgi:hypothetical protein